MIRSSIGHPLKGVTSCRTGHLAFVVSVVMIRRPSFNLNLTPYLRKNVFHRQVLRLGGQGGANAGLVIGLGGSFGLAQAFLS